MTQYIDLNCDGGNRLTVAEAKALCDLVQDQLTTTWLARGVLIRARDKLQTAIETAPYLDVNKRRAK